MLFDSLSASIWARLLGRRHRRRVSSGTDGLLRRNSSSWPDEPPDALITSDWRKSSSFFLFVWRVRVLTLDGFFLRMRFPGFSPQRPRCDFFLGGRPRLGASGFSPNVFSVLCGRQSSSVLQKPPKFPGGARFPHILPTPAYHGFRPGSKT